MKSFNYHYNFALNDSMCDTYFDPTLQNGSWRAAVLPAYFHMDGLFPEQCALPIYGFVVPPLALLVVIVNALILVIFAKPHIRSHTTFILTVIAVADSLNISLPSIIYVYMYTLGHHRDFVPYTMCFPTYLLFHLLPEMFNLVSLWSTILLACVRFRCLQYPFKAKDHHSNSRIAVGIVVVFVIAMGVQLPSIGLFDFLPVNVTSLTTNQTMETCIVTTSRNINKACVLREIHIWIELFANSFIPCCALIVLDLGILYTLRKAERKRGCLQRSGSTFKLRIKEKNSNESCCSESVKHVSSVEKPKEIYDALQHKTSGEHAAKDDDVKVPVLINGLNNGKTRTSLLDKETVRDTEMGNLVIVNALIDSNHFPTLSDEVRRRTYSDSFPRRCQKRVTSALSIPSSLSRQFCSSILRQQSVESKDFKNSSTRSNESYKRLTKESRRTSWMIFAVVALICSHELLYGILFAQQMIQNVGPIPLNFLGCGTVYLSLWQYVTYPLIFLIYCFMSAAFRLELRRTLTCSKPRLGDRQSKARNSVFMSPCTIRKSISQNREDKEASKNLIDK